VSRCLWRYIHALSGKPVPARIVKKGPSGWGISRTVQLCGYGRLNPHEHHNAFLEHVPQRQCDYSHISPINDDFSEVTERQRKRPPGGGLFSCFHPISPYSAAPDILVNISLATPDPAASRR
jgi:hypothetical protein